MLKGHSTRFNGLYMMWAFFLKKKKISFNFWLLLKICSIFKLTLEFQEGNSKRKEIAVYLTFFFHYLKNFQNLLFFDKIFSPFCRFQLCCISYSTPVCDMLFDTVTIDPWRWKPEHIVRLNVSLYRFYFSRFWGIHFLLFNYISSLPAKY